MTTREKLQELMDPDELAAAVAQIKNGLPNIVEDLDFDAVRYGMLLMIASAEQVYKEYTWMQQINAKLEEEST